MGSLFAGIGGFDLGFERAGFKTSWQVEIDPFCQKVLAKNFPEAERFGDIRKCGSHNLKPVDVICGGFPCQDISNAGLRAGIEGERSGLWKEYARIICELRPKFVVVENVAALLGRGMGVVLGDLAEIGYDAEWKIISARSVGANHRRDRLWIVAYPEGQPFLELPQASILADAECVGQSGQGEHESPFDSQENPFREASGFVDAFRKGTLPYVCRRHDGISPSMDRNRVLGNAVVPKIPEMIARRINLALDK